jgi:N-acetylglucosamine-6-phosphate deacetylase
MGGTRKLFINALMYLPNEEVKRGCLTVKDGIIEQICEGPEAIDFSGMSEMYDLDGSLLIPGFIDIHNHGAGGYSVMDACEDISVYEKLCAVYPSFGVTSFLGATLTDEIPRIKGALLNAADYIDHDNATGAELLGIYLEGPYINPSKCGGQNPEYVRSIDLKEIADLIDISGNNIKVFTLAPELEGAMEAIEYLKRHGITVSAGHSEAGYDTMREAANKGLSHITHLFNGMPPMHHREPGIVGAGLMMDELSIELICDGLHIHRDLISHIFKSKPQDKTVLVSDSVKPAGCPDGEYMLGELQVIKSNNSYNR